MADGVIFTKAQARWLWQQARRVANLRGPGVHKSESAITIDQRGTGGGPVEALAKITGQGANPGRFTAEAVWPDKTKVANGQIFDGLSDNEPELTMVAGPAPATDQIVLVRLMRNQNGNAVWWFTGGGPFPATITGASSDGTHQWVYSWSEAELSAGSVSAKTGGRSGTDNAHNLAEIGHGSSAAWGVDPSGSSYDATNLSPQAVGSTQSGSYNVGVWMYETINREFYFTLMGSHDGTCEESS
jgi:hypothetical protein